MFPRIVVASLFVLALSGVQPPNYTEKGLCDLWAGARCHATSCLPDAKERCTQASVQCRGRSEVTVPPDHAQRVAACARALLTSRCGDPAPEECSGVSGP